MHPNVICVGAQKAGTTWLYEQLIKHPQVSESKTKEINYFSDKCSSYTNNFFNNFELGTEWYFSQLNIEGNKLTCDFSPNYLWDERAAERIFRLAPAAKILIILREPVSRAFSQYLHARKTFYVGESFEDAIQRYPEFLRRSLYTDDVARFIERFTSQNIKILFYEDLRDNSSGFLADVMNFLELPTFTPAGASEKVNRALYPRYTFLNRLVSVVYGAKRTALGRAVWSSPLLRAIGNSVVRRARAMNLQEVPNESLRDETARRLRSDFFEEDVRKLEVLLGRPLPWSNVPLSFRAVEKSGTPCS